MAAVATNDSAPSRVRKLPVRIRRRQRSSITVHVALTLVIGIIVPFAAYIALGQAGVDIASAMSALVVTSLLATAVLIWMAGFASLRRPDAPTWPTPWYPPATAIVLTPPHDDADALARMLVRLRRDYAAPLQLIVTYSSPIAVHVQEALEEIARRDPKLLLLYADRGRSKADALSDALACAEGEFVGIFNSCQLPDRRVFNRAWMWLSNGYDAVQGRPVVTNGDTSNVASRDSVESVAPGYAGHTTESFDSTTSFWMTDVLKRTCRHEQETEAFIPFLYLDRWVPVDPDLIAPRLAPTTLSGLVYQRVAWAEDTFRRSLKNMRRALRNAAIPRHLKIELVYLQLWRPIHTWLSLQIVPLVGYWFWRAGLHSRVWIVPAIELLALYVVHLAPAQTFFAYLSADQEMRRHKRWFFSFCVRSPLFYVPFETLMHGVAQIRATVGEPRW
jgi:hypothetical protein